MCLGGLFSTPSLPNLPVPKVPELPAAPTLANPAVAQALARNRRIAAAQSGRASTILTGPLGISNDTQGDTQQRGKTLLGQ